MLDYPQSTFISKIEVIGNILLTTRELDNGTEVLELSMPAVLTADLYLNEPRFIKLPQLMLAKKKPLEHLMLSGMDIKLRSTTRLLKAFDGEVKKQCKFINTVPELFEVLQAKKVI